MAIDLKTAEQVARAALAEAERAGTAICVAVADATGRLIVFFKMDGTGVLDGHEAMRRAVTSAGSGKPSDDSTATDNRALAASLEGIGTSGRPGGLPMLAGRQRIGGVGVCGAGTDQDIACARAAVAALPQ